MRAFEIRDLDRYRHIARSGFLRKAHLKNNKIQKYQKRMQ